MTQTANCRTIEVVVTEKTCARCGLNKMATSFSKASAAKDGHQSWCKECTRERHALNRDADCAQMRRYHAANAQEIAERKREYRSGGRSIDKPWPAESISYRSAHFRVTATYGPAANHPCAKCGRPAKDWSYRGGCPSELTHIVGEEVLTGAYSHMMGNEVKYSPDPQRYDPMCRSCHVKRDRFGAA